MDGVHDPAIAGTLVAPATGEYVQIINTGNHWVCLSTISCRPGTINPLNAKDVYIRPKIGPSDTEDVYIRPLTSILFLFSVVQGFYPWLFQRTWEQFENPLTTEFCTVAQHNTQKALFIFAANPCQIQHGGQHTSNDS